MNTDQKYAGKGDYATSNEQTADNATLTAEMPANGNQLTSFDPHGGASLVGFVRGFFADNHASTYIGAINSALHHQFTQTDEEGKIMCSLKSTANIDALHNLLEASLFMAELSERSQAIELSEMRALANIRERLIVSQERSIELYEENANLLRRSVTMLSEKAGLPNPFKAVEEEENA